MSQFARQFSAADTPPEPRAGASARAALDLADVNVWHADELAQPLDLRVPSGHALLDEEALQTFSRAQPLPPPPASLPDPVELEVPVEFFLR